MFIHSDEVKKELPLDTKRFEKIDGEVKATLMELWKVKKVCWFKMRTLTTGVVLYGIVNHSWWRY